MCPPFNGVSSVDNGRTEPNPSQLGSGGSGGGGGLGFGGSIGSGGQTSAGGSMGAAGDNTAGGQENFYEGALTLSAASTATTDAVQANIVAAGYGM